MDQSHTIPLPRIDNRCERSEHRSVVDCERQRVSTYLYERSESTGPAIYRRMTRINDPATADRRILRAKRVSTYLYERSEFDTNQPYTSRIKWIQRSRYRGSTDVASVSEYMTRIDTDDASVSEYKGTFTSEASQQDLRYINRRMTRWNDPADADRQTLRASASI